MKVLVRNVDNVFFFFKQKTAYDMRICDWSSDVCASDLHADRSAADDDQMFRARCIFEYRLVGQMGRHIKARDRRHGGARAGGYDETPGADFSVADDHRMAILEAGIALQHRDRKRVVSGKSVSVSGDTGGRGINKN